MEVHWEAPAVASGNPVGDEWRKEAELQPETLGQLPAFAGGLTAGMEERRIEEDSDASDWWRWESLAALAPVDILVLSFGLVWSLSSCTWLSPTLLGEEKFIHPPTPTPPLASLEALGRSFSWPALLVGPGYALWGGCTTGVLVGRAEGAAHSCLCEGFRWAAARMPCRYLWLVSVCRAHSKSILCSAFLGKVEDGLSSGYLFFFLFSFSQHIMQVALQ